MLNPAFVTGDNGFDIVSHVGSINFFYDKALGVKEMLRVAKKGSKLLITDETSDYIEQQHQKNALSKKHFDW